MENLTDREQSILKILAEGKQNTEIAHKLSISISTAQNHIHSIFQKIGVRNRTEAT